MSYQLELRHIRYFLTVAHELHFRKAAERLYISQPGLSRQIKELEESLGIVLFDRHNRRVELTPAGRYLQTELADYVKRIDDTIHHAKLLSDGIQGELKLGYVGSAMQSTIPNLLKQIQNEKRNIHVSLKEMDNERQVQELFSRDIDLGFVRTERIPRGLNSHPVLVEPFCLVLPSSHPIDRSNFKDLSNFKEEAFILFDPQYSPSYFEKVMQIFDDQGFVPKVSHSTVHAGSIYKLVESGFGISIVPESLIASYAANLKFIVLHDIRQRTVLSAVWNPDSRNPVLKEVVTLLTNGKMVDI